MMFLEIKKNERNDKVENYKMVSTDDIAALHKDNSDLASWTRGARLNSRFALSNKNGRFMYIRTDECPATAAEVDKLAH